MHICFSYKNTLVWRQLQCISGGVISLVAECELAVLRCRGNTLIPANAGTAVRDHSLNYSPYLLMYQKKQSFAYKNMPYLSSFVGERGLKRAGFSS